MFEIYWLLFIRYMVGVKVKLTDKASSAPNMAKCLCPLVVTTVLNTRRRIFSALEHYVRTRKHDEKTRLGDLTLFVLSPLLANSICEDILVTKLSGVARLDVLMEELMLADAEEQNKCTTQR
ncbi:hypothetical protein GCK32_020713, partial [Trichostrongylus colubriformis]